MLSTMRRTTVVLPDPEPPATPMTRGLEAGHTWLAYMLARLRLILLRLRRAHRRPRCQQDFGDATLAVPILAGRLLLSNDARRKPDGEVRQGEKSVILVAVTKSTRFFTPPPAPII